LKSSTNVSDSSRGVPDFSSFAAFHGILDQIIHHRFQIVAALLVDLQLAVGAGAVLENFADVVDGAAAVQLVDRLIDEADVFVLIFRYSQFNFGLCAG
jgi:hypothetical protein